MIKYCEKLLIKYQRFIKFGIVGVSNTFIGLAIYYILVKFSVNYQVANFIGFIIAALNSYYWNSKYVFKKKYSHKDIIKFYIVNFITWGTSILLLFIFIEILNISKYIAPLLNLFITVPANYLMSKLWTFRD
ncbi:MAG: GtrA family protein [Fusobacteriaceae bacterium]